MQGKKVRLQRNEHFVDGGQRVEGQNTQRRRAVDEQIIELFSVFFQLVAQNQLAAHDARQFHLGGGEIEMRADDRQVIGHLPPYGRQAGVSRQHVVDGTAFAARLNAQVQGRVSLRIQIGQADSPPGGGQRRTEIDGRGGFAHAPLLIDDRDLAHRNSLAE